MREMRQAAFLANVVFVPRYKGDTHSANRPVVTQ